MTDKLSRLKQAIEYLKDNGRVHSNQNIADLVGIHRSNLSRVLSGNERYLTTGFLTRFADAYSDYINKEWLVDGTGEMAVPKSYERIHIPIEVSAGFTGVSMGAAMESECDYVTLDSLYGKDRDCTVRAKGDSMYPTIFDGDYIMCQKLNSEYQINDSDIYVLDTLDGAVIKRIIPADNGVTAVSENPDYKPFWIASEAILSIYKVGGILRKF